MNFTTPATCETAAEKHLIRTAQLAERLDELELKEQRRKNRSKPNRKYKEIFRGKITAVQVRLGDAKVSDENGLELGRLATNPKVSEVLNKGDILHVMMGRNNIHWHIIFVFGLTTKTPQDDATSIPPHVPAEKPKTTQEMHR